MHSLSTVPATRQRWPGRCRVRGTLTSRTFTPQALICSPWCAPGLDISHSLPDICSAGAWCMASAPKCFGRCAYALLLISLSDHLWHLCCTGVCFALLPRGKSDAELTKALADLQTCQLAYQQLPLPAGGHQLGTAVMLLARQGVYQACARNKVVGRLQCHAN